MRNRYDAAYSRGFWHAFGLGIGIVLIALYLFVSTHPIYPLIFAREIGATHGQ